MSKYTLRDLLITKPSDDGVGVSKLLFNEWRSCEMLSAIFAFVGLVVATLDYEFSFSHTRNHENCEENHVNKEFLREIIATTTFASFFFLVQRDNKKAQWEKYLIATEPTIMTLICDYPVQITRKMKNTLSFSRIIEIIILFVFPYPYLNIPVYIPYRYHGNTIKICYTLSEFLYIFMVLRLIFLYRAVINYTPYQNHLARSFCLKYNVKANVRFVFKCLVTQHPLNAIVFLLVIPSMIICGSMLRIFERPMMDISHQDFQNPLNAIWCMFAAMSSVGYGDIFPTGYLGRIMAVVGYTLGTVFLSLIIITLQKHADFSTNQSNAFASISKTKSAARTIQAGLLYSICIRNFGKKHPISRNNFELLRKKIINFKKVREMISGYGNQDDELVIAIKDRLDKLNGGMDKIERLCDKIIAHSKENRKALI